MLTFALFCAVSSGTYFVNDSVDAAADRNHPVKRFRPVAAGVISGRLALWIGIVLMGAGIGLGAALRLELGLVLGVYVALQLSYTLYLKHQPVFDLAAVAGGFVLRGIAGGVAIPVPISEWFLIVTTFGSLLMVTGKRLAEHAELGELRGVHRPTLDAYSPTFLRIVVAIAATGAILGYCLWALSLQTGGAPPRRHMVPAIDRPRVGRPAPFHLPDRPRGRGETRRTRLGEPPAPVLGAVWVILFALGGVRRLTPPLRLAQGR